MKKILALVLATAMLSTSAFALTWNKVDAGDPKADENGMVQVSGRIATLPMKDFIKTETLTLGHSSGASATKLAGKGQSSTHGYVDRAFKMDVSLGLSDAASLERTVAGMGYSNASEKAAEEVKEFAKDAASNIRGYQFTEENFTINYKAKKGRDLADVKFDGAGNIVMTFKAGAPRAKNVQPDFILEELSVRSKKYIKDIAGKETILKPGEVYKFNVDNSLLKTTNDQFVIVSTKAESTTIEEGTITLTAGMKDSKVKANATESKATANYTSDNVTITTRVYADDVLTFDVTSKLSDVAKDMLKKNDEATVDVYAITAEGFYSALNVVIQAGYINDVEPSKQFVYAMDAEGKLTPSTLTFDDDLYAFTGKVNGSTTIVISDKELLGVTAGGEEAKPEEVKPEEETENPSTGLVVNVAAAIVK